MLPCMRVGGGEEEAEAGGVGDDGEVEGEPGYADGSGDAGVAHDASLAGRSHAFLKLRAVLPLVGAKVRGDHRGAATQRPIRVTK